MITVFGGRKSCSLRVTWLLEDDLGGPCLNAKDPLNWRLK
jgi:hypothetical protein